MNLNLVYLSSSFATFEVLGEDIYEAKEERTILLNGKEIFKTKKNVFSVNNLSGGKEYRLTVKACGLELDNIFKTPEERYVLNIRRFGAVGNGKTDDTMKIQTAINCCPEGGRVLIPEGKYQVSSIFLKSNITIELEEGAILISTEEREKLGILPGIIDSVDEKEELYLGTWEGNPLDCFTSLITGIGVKNVKIIGKGTLDGGATEEGWWKTSREKIQAWRPKLFNLVHCEDVSLVGLDIQNSPSWTLHPVLSENLKFIDLRIKNPADSPNTDGLDPEGCKNIEIIGVDISVGDDCIALKSGKIYLGSTLKRPTENVTIRNCKMRFGHGAVVMGSEMAGGIKNIHIEKCFFMETDKGLRVKTRRGRGKDGSVKGIFAKDIEMDGVKIPFVINSFYHCCDPDGKTEYVYSKKPLPVDERTPEVKNIHFENIVANNCEIAAGFMYGLPEKKIDNVVIKNVEVDFRRDSIADYPAMMCHIEKEAKKGFFIGNAENVTLENITIHNVDGEPLRLQDVDNLKIENKGANL